MLLHAEKWDNGKLLVKKSATTEEVNYEEEDGQFTGRSSTKEIKVTDTLINHPGEGGGTCTLTVDITCSDNQDAIGGLELIFNQIKDSLAAGESDDN